MHVFAKTPTRLHSFTKEETAARSWRIGGAKERSKPFFADSEFHWPSFEVPLKSGFWSASHPVRAVLQWLSAHLRIQPSPNATAFVAPDTSWFGQPGRAHAPDVGIVARPLRGQVRQNAKTQTPVAASEPALDAWVLLDANGECTRINESFSTLFDLHIQDLMHMPPAEILAAIQLNCQPLKPFPQFEYLYEKMLNSSLNAPNYKCIIEIDWPRKTLVQLSRMTIRSESISGILFFRDVTHSVMESEKQKRSHIKTDEDLRQYFNEVYGLDKAEA